MAKTTIAEYFERDPESLTKEDRDDIIAQFRANRKVAVAPEKGKATTTRKPRKRKPQIDPAKIDDLLNAVRKG